MKILINLAIKGNVLLDWFHDDFSEISSFMNKHRIDGIEAILYNPGTLTDIPAGMIKGLHLIYWPMWMDLWLSDHENLHREFINEQNVFNYYGFNDKNGFIEKYREEFDAAKALECEYMVFHVSQISIEETYTRNFRYQDKSVLDKTISLVNEVFTGNGPLLLFENLWSSGLNFLDYEMTKYFIEGIKYENKGFMLDISHLIMTNPAISNYDQAVDYINMILDDLGDLKKYIKGIHLNKSNFDDYIRADHHEKAESSNQKTDFVEKLVDVYHHISQIDTHVPFESDRIKEIVETVSPSYLVYEFLPTDIIDWETKIDSQNRFLMR